MRLGLWGICLAVVGSAIAASAGSFDDLLGQRNLTPEGLAHVIAGFSFELAPQLQTPESFLQRKRGDCADFANLASLVLARRGYTTKLIVVMMPRQTHVVCYIKEAGGFLDYNHRADAHPIIPSDGSLEDIAGKVAGDFQSPWRMASVFRYRESTPVFLECAFATEPSKAQLRAERAKINRTANAPRATLTARNVDPADASVATVPSQGMVN